MQCSSNIYNKASFHETIKMRGKNPTLTINPNIFLYIFTRSYPVQVREPPGFETHGECHIKSKIGAISSP